MFIKERESPNHFLSEKIMLKFIKIVSGYKAELGNGNFIKLEKHCQDNRWIGYVMTADYEELPDTYQTAKTKKELVESFTHEFG